MALSAKKKPYVITLDPGELLSVEEFAALPPDPEGWNTYLIEGKVYRMPPVKDPWHDWILENLTAALVPYVRKHRLGRCSFEQLGYDLTPKERRHKGTAKAPDLAFVQKSRIPLMLEARRRKEYAKLAPDLAVEIVSPSQDTFEEMERRAHLWLNAGSRLVWNIWPEREQVDVWPIDGEMQTLGVGVLLDGLEVVPGFSMPVADLFVYDE